VHNPDSVGYESTMNIINIQNGITTLYKYHMVKTMAIKNFGEFGEWHSICPSFFSFFLPIIVFLMIT